MVVAFGAGKKGLLGGKMIYMRIFKGSEFADQLVVGVNVQNDFIHRGTTSQ